MGEFARNGAGILRRALACLLALALALILPVSAQAEGSGMIRVKLTRLGTPSIIEMQLDCAYVASGDAKMNLPTGSTIVVRASGGEMTLESGGATLYCGDSLKLLRCGSGGLRFVDPKLSNRFCGDLYLSASGSAITAILRLYLEDYLYGVVACEMSNSYPLEALKAQAVAARNYALRKMQTRASKAYDVTDNTSDQAFKGYDGSKTRVLQAVDETSGRVLYAGGKLASCYYAASNGGQTESTKNAWGNSLSYSVVKDDPYDLENSSAKKKEAAIRKDGSGLHASLEAALRKGMEQQGWGEDAQIVSIAAITPFNPKYAVPSRLYRSLRFELRVREGNRSGSAQVDVSTYGGMEDWYGLSINSGTNETIAVEEDEASFRIVFRRWGHGIGMSQRGAQRMASAYGMGVSEILDFYYPGTQLQSVSLSKEGAHSQLPAGGAAIASAQLMQDAELYAGERAIGRIAAGTEIEIYAMDGEWAEIGLRGLSGRIAAIALDANPSPVPSETPAITAEPTAVSTAAPTPTVEMSAFPTLPAPDTAEPTAKPTESPTEAPAATATAQPTLPAITMEPTESPTEAPTATATAKPTLPVITAKPTAKPTIAPLPTVRDEPMPTPKPAPEGADGMLVATGELYASVNVSSGSTLALRKAASTQSARMEKLDRGAKLRVLAFNDDWACVQTQSGRQGFVARQYLRLLESGEDSQPEATPKPTQRPDEEGDPFENFTAVETDVIFCKLPARAKSGAKLYKSDSTSSKLLSKIPEDERVTVLAYNEDWAYVKYGSRKGFVQMRKLGKA